MQENGKAATIRREVEESARTSREPDLYCKYFDFELEDLRGLKILDLGAGDSRFARSVDEHSGSVVMLDPKYAQRKPYYPGNAVTGIAQNLPFRSGSFDLSIASFFGLPQELMKRC